MENKIHHSKPVPPFVRFCAANIPMVFDDSLSYYEALCALWKWLQTDVIDVINNNARVTEVWREELTTFENNVTEEIEGFETVMRKDFSDLNDAFDTLKNWVETYFDNLDVQEEINNKLDEMVEDGVLQEIITTYIQSNVKWTFDTVADMKDATNLVNGSFACTLGFHTIGDGGASTYKIKDVTGVTTNDRDKIAIGNSLYAELVKEPVMTPEQYGAYGDGTNDDTDSLQACLDNGKKAHLTGIYLVSSTINVKESVDMDGDAYIKADDTLTTKVVMIAPSHQIGNTYNINVDASGVAGIGIAVGSPRKCILNLNVINAGTTGIDCNNLSSTGNNENEFKCNVIGNSNGTTSTGVLCNCFDSIFSSIVTQDCEHGVEVNNGELIADSVHSWLSNDTASTLWATSAVVYFASSYNANIKWLYQDSVKYGILSEGAYGSVDFFEYNNTLTGSHTDYINVKNTTRAIRLTINRFKNAVNENQLLKYDISGTSSAFGVLDRNGVSSAPSDIENYPTFTDCDNAPQYGTFYCQYDTTNLPSSTNGYLECKVVGNMAIQNFYRHDLASVQRVYYRSRLLGTSTWSSWFYLEPTS